MMPYSEACVSSKMFSHCFPDYDSCPISDFLDAERYLVILRKEEKLA